MDAKEKMGHTSAASLVARQTCGNDTTLDRHEIMRSVERRGEGKENVRKRTPRGGQKYRQRRIGCIHVRGCSTITEMRIELPRGPPVRTMAPACMHTIRSQVIEIRCESGW